MPLPHMFGGSRGPFEKWWPDLLLHATVFKMLLDIIRIKIRHLKGENKWGNSGRLDSNGLGIGGLKVAQRNELIVPGQNIALNAFSSKRRLIGMFAADK